MRITRARLAVLAGLCHLLPSARADFRLTAGNWTHSTNLFSELHFVPGYNEAGQWDILTGGNWTPTNHSDVSFVGDAAAYLCPCPLPPCAADTGPVKPGFNTSVFTCLDSGSGGGSVNLSAVAPSFVACTVFHGERTNVTCVTAQHAIACELPSLEENNTLQNWWENNILPSRSFFSRNVTAISCIERGMGEQAFSHVANMTQEAPLQQALSRERCEVVCTQVCETVCIHDHISVHQLFERLNDWIFDPTVELNSRSFVLNGSVVEERRPAQWMHGAVPSNLGQRRQAGNVTCTLPTLTAARSSVLFGGVVNGVYDLLGRRFNVQNVFDITLCECHMASAQALRG